MVKHGKTLLSLFFSTSVEAEASCFVCFNRALAVKNASKVRSASEWTSWARQNRKSTGLFRRWVSHMAFGEAAKMDVHHTHTREIELVWCWCLFFWVVESRIQMEGLILAVGCLLFFPTLMLRSPEYGMLSKCRWILAPQHWLIPGYSESSNR